MGKSAVLFFALFVVGNLALRALQPEGISPQAAAASLVVGLVAAVIFAAIQKAIGK